MIRQYNKYWILILSVVISCTLVLLFKSSDHILLFNSSDHISATNKTLVLGNCILNVPMHTDGMYEFVQQCVSLLDYVTEKQGVHWFGSGQSTVAILRTGAVHIKLEHVSTHGDRRTYHDFETYIVADKFVKIQHVWKDLARETSIKFPSLQCKSNSLQDGCSVITHKQNELMFRFVINAHGIYSKDKNELMISDRHLFVNHILPLQRIFPVAYASYYGLRIPVPHDPVYFFSHVIPKKDTLAATERRYEYKQGCENIAYPTTINTIENTNSFLRNEIDACGKLLYERNISSFYKWCRKGSTREVYQPLHVLLDNTPQHSSMYMEDFPHVTIIHSGSGSYKLQRPHGLNQNDSWSQFGQDKLIDTILNGKQNGFFVEMGALDGEAFSNTLFFEKKRSWHGLLVEANPFTFEQMLGRDRNCYMINTCISSSDPPELTFKMAGPITSSVELMPEIHRNRINNELFTSTKDMWSHQGENYVVQCKSLSVIMDKLKNPRIDFFSLDVDGSEMFILQSIDWDKHDIDLIMIETEYNRDDIVTFMNNKDYAVISTLGIDDIFKKNRH